MQNEEYDLKTSAKAFNTKNIKEAEHNAVQLKQILDGKGIFIKLNDIPDKPDYFDTVSKKAIYVLNNRLPQVYLEKVGNNWYYSKETVNAIPWLHKLIYPFGSAVWVKLFPYQAGKTFLKLHYWQWIGFAGIVLIFLITFFISRFIAYLIIKKIAERKISNPFDDLDLLRVIANSFSLVLAFFVLKLILPTLLLSTKLSASLTKSVDLAAAVILIWYLFSLTDFIMRYAAQAAKKTPSQLDDQLIQVLRRFLKAGVIIFGIFYLLRILDVNITTVIAGISIGGLAIALAAQDTVKNFIGSLMIFADRPFKIGDTISGDGFEGVVQEVGFRSTRIKTPSESIVTVANGKLADMTIDNKGYKILKKYKTEIFISYETPLPKVEKFI
ncbi:MAG: mechanosensitive ion channel [Sphingobacteriales bacterium]|nr:mechanosensitive ion channel [Sphingobacteriales bacterium]